MKKDLWMETEFPQLWSGTPQRHTSISRQLLPVSPPPAFTTSPVTTTTPTPRFPPACSRLLSLGAHRPRRPGLQTLGRFSHPGRSAATPAQSAAGGAPRRSHLGQGAAAAAASSSSAWRHRPSRPRDCRQDCGARTASPAQEGARRARRDACLQQGSLSAPLRDFPGLATPVLVTGRARGSCGLPALPGRILWAWVSGPVQLPSLCGGPGRTRRPPRLPLLPAPLQSLSRTRPPPPAPPLPSARSLSTHWLSREIFLFSDLALFCPLHCHHPQYSISESFFFFFFTFSCRIFLLPHPSQSSCYILYYPFLRIGTYPG